jgi:hypothetical protein
VVAFYDRGAQHSLYAFVEAGTPLSAGELRKVMTERLPDIAPPEHVQICQALPRRAEGDIRIELLQLVASNQLDEIEALVKDKTEHAILSPIIAQRCNLADRF